MKIKDIESKYQNIQAKLHNMTASFHIESEPNYLSWLRQTHEYAVFATRILAMTGARFALDKTAIASRFIRHATEEKGHDKLLENDAKALGKSIFDLPILPEAEAFHKSLYFFIYQQNISVMMGWVLMLEGFAVCEGPQLYERAKAAHGDKACSFLRVHTNEDPEHIQSAFATLKHFNDFELSQVQHGIELYAHLYANIYRAIHEQSNDRTIATLQAA